VPDTFVKTFPCAGCGARLTFAPGTHTLKCEHCGFTNEIAENDSRIEEQDFDTYLKALEGKQETYEEEHVRCEKCGAEQNLGANLSRASAPSAAPTSSRRATPIAASSPRR